MEIGTLIYGDGVVDEFPRRGLTPGQTATLRTAAGIAASIGPVGSNWTAHAVGWITRVYEGGSDSPCRRLSTASAISGSSSSTGPRLTPCGRARS